MLVVGKGVHWVNRKDQVCYECRISKIDDSTIFHISYNNFKVETAPSNPFEDESVPSTSAQRPSEQAVSAQRQRQEDAVLCIKAWEVVRNVIGDLVQKKLPKCDSRVSKSTMTMSLLTRMQSR